MVHAARPVLLIEVHEHFAIGARAKTMTARLELGALSLEAVELAVDDRVNALVLVRERLRAPLEVDDAQPGVPEPHASGCVEPVSLAIRSAVVERRGGATERLGIDGSRRGEESDDAAHR